VLIRCLPFLLAPAFAAHAYDFSALKRQGHLSDFARVADGDARAEVEAYLERVAASARVDVALVTLPTLHGEPIEDVAALLLRKWEVGGNAAGSGALLLLAIGEGRSRVAFTADLETLLPASSSRALLRSMRPALKHRHFSDAVVLAAAELGAQIGRAKRVAIGGTPPSPRQVRASSESEWIADGAALLGAGLLGLLLVAVARRGQRSRHASHGGFGGYDSDGGAGGFGGESRHGPERGW
jgi:uncharacterized protein